MSDAVYCFDVDDCLEIGGQIRLPSTFGPVTIQSIRQEAAPPDGDICGIVGNWVNLPGLIPDWREFLSFLKPPIPSNEHKAYWLAWVRAQYPGYRHYVMVGNDPNGHAKRPAYWDQQWPGTLPITHVPGDRLLSDDIKAAAEAGFEFIKEDEWAAGRRIGTVPPPIPGRPVIQFPKYARLPMIEKVYSIPGALKSANYDSGVVEAIVSVTGNLDKQKDVIHPGAYKKALESGRLPKIVKAHDFRTWLGKTVEAEELKPADPRLPAQISAQGWGGVYVKGEFTMEDPIAAAVHAHLKRGVVDEFSVGFDIDQDYEGKSGEEIDGDGVRHIKSIYPWYEWSPVFIGANPATLPLAVKDGERSRELITLEALEEAARVLAVPERVEWMLGLKSDLSTQAKRNAAKYKLRVNGKVKYPINDCSDVRDAWALRGRSSIPAARVASYVRRAAGKLGCNGPWNSGGKEDDPVELITPYGPDQLARIERAYETITLGVHALREMVNQTGADADYSNDEANVPELSLKELEAIGAAAAAYRARHRPM